MALLAEILSGSYVEFSKLDARSMHVGTTVTDVLLGNRFVLTVSSAAVDHATVETVLGHPELRWLKIVGAAFVSVSDEAALTAVDVSGLTIGTLAYVIDEATYFQLVTDGPDLIWQQVTFGGSGTEPRPGTNLGNASVTINPASDAASSYTMPVATQTADRTITLGTSGSPATNSIVQVVRRDLSAHSLVIVNGGTGAGTLFTFGPSPATAQGATFYFDGTDYHFLNVFFVA